MHLQETSICVSFQQTPIDLSACSSQASDFTQHMNQVAMLRRAILMDMKAYSALSNILVPHHHSPSHKIATKLLKNDFFFYSKLRKFFFKLLLCWQSKITVLPPKMLIN